MIYFNISSDKPYNEEIINDFKLGKYINGKDKSIVVIFKHFICEPIIDKIISHVSKFVVGSSK
jgi:hypothetical protein